MKLLFLTSEDWAFLTHRLPMALAAQQAGFEVHVATNFSGREHEIEALGFKVHRLPFKRGSLSPFTLLYEIWLAFKLLIQLKPHLVHVIAVKPILVAGLAGFFLPRLKFIHALTGLGSALGRKTLLSKILFFILGVVLKRPNALTLVQNSDDLNELILAFQLKNTALIRGSGIDTAYFKALPQPQTPVKIALVARMLKSKGVLDAVQASHLLTAKNIAHELLLVGTPDPLNPESLTEAQYKALASKNISLLGHIQDVREVWAQATIAILPQQEREGLPKALLEAASCGRALIATDVPGCREIVIDKKNGFLVPACNPNTLADALEKLILDKNLRETMGKASRELVLNDLSAQAVGEAVVKLYKHQLAL